MKMSPFYLFHSKSASYRVIPILKWHSRKWVMLIKNWFNTMESFMSSGRYILKQITHSSWLESGYL
jgi:hypothetical protein